jgi:hypothetical protein
VKRGGWGVAGGAGVTVGRAGVGAGVAGADGLTGADGLAGADGSAGEDGFGAATAGEHAATKAAMTSIDATGREGRLERIKKFLVRVERGDCGRARGSGKYPRQTPGPARRFRHRDGLSAS